MKRKEILFNAVSGISEDKAADAFEYENPKKRNTVLRSVLYGAGIAAIFCSFIVLSFVLLKISGPKTLPDDANAAVTGNELITEAETEIETEKETDAVIETADTVKPGSGAFIENPVVEMSIEEFRQMEPYKYFIPTEIPEGFVNLYSHRWVKGEYLYNDGTYRKVDEHGNICFTDSTVNSDYDYVQFNITVRKSVSDTPATEKLSVSDVKYRSFRSARNGSPERNGTDYVLKLYTDDGWCVTYFYRIYPSNFKEFTEKDLFDLVVTAPYFKDHPIATDDSLN
ncbi:MAG: hypothetical protein IJT49_00765 [Clostridia bacterium]|nr:hypothetical protein [Clostridia bacterium]